MKELEDKREMSFEEQRFSKYRKRIKIQVIAILAVIAVIASMAMVIVAQRKQYRNVLDNAVVLEPVTPEIVLQVLSTATKGIEELNTMEYSFTNSARFSDSKQIKNWNVPFTEKAFTLQWSGVIKAGIDLGDVKVNINGKTIIVSIPEAKIFSYDVDEDSIEYLDEKNNVFNPISVKDKIEFDKATENDMKQKAIDSGLLESAQQNAEVVLMRFLLADTRISKDYNIEFVLK